MQLIKHPKIEQIEKILQRPSIESSSLDSLVREVFQKVTNEGDKALFKYTKKFDKVDLQSLEVTKEEFLEAEKIVSEDLKKAILIAKNNIQKFHKNQIQVEKEVETMLGIKCYRKSLPIQKVGLYIPGGTAPLFSTVLMLGIPAKIAGCDEIILTTPPNLEGKIHPAILWTANQTGITKIFKVGGSQAIAGLTIGTESIPKVYKIFGPGNQFVVKAKQIAMEYGVAMDMPAGPSEVCVITDKKANPKFIASDLLAQAEHGSDSQVVLISDSLEILEKTKLEVEIQLETLPRKELTQKSLEYAKFILTRNIVEAFQISNIYAPEHLIIQTQNYKQNSKLVKNAGSVFLGEYTPESLGDYASGTNHSLPTNGFAKNYSGVSVDSFVKKITFQEASKNGLKNIAKTVMTMAKAETLEAHSRAVEVRS
jgi:histidinol dehydrogenase